MYTVLSYKHTHANTYTHYNYSECYISTGNADNTHRRKGIRFLCMITTG